VETALVVALVSGVVALVGAAIAAGTQLRLRRLDLEAKVEESRSEARVVLDRYRAPLLDAAWDLGDRIDNIVRRSFLSSYRGTDREPVALSSTLFRVAQYFGWTEVLRREIQLLRFESADDTRRTAYFISLVTRRFATDWYDSAEAIEQAKQWSPERWVALPPGHLMLWQEEQRGIGERMIEGDGRACMGYASFTEHFEEKFALLSEFKSQLRTPGVETSQRLIEIRDALARLVEQLDDEQRYVVDQVGYTSWVEAARASPCWNTYAHPA
jgi:hypothetical protein